MSSLREQSQLYHQQFEQYHEEFLEWIHQHRNALAERRPLPNTRPPVPPQMSPQLEALLEQQLGEALPAQPPFLFPPPPPARPPQKLKDLPESSRPSAYRITKEDALGAHACHANNEPICCICLEEFIHNQPIFWFHRIPHAVSAAHIVHYECAKNITIKIISGKPYVKCPLCNSEDPVTIENKYMYDNPTSAGGKHKSKKHMYSCRNNIKKCKSKKTQHKNKSKTTRRKNN
jgi:hypothetical protein